MENMKEELREAVAYPSCEPTDHPGSIFWKHLWTGLTSRVSLCVRDYLPDWPLPDLRVPTLLAVGRDGEKETKRD